MSLSALQINDFRNLKNLSIEFSDNCNLFYGNNGSGKTSLLEAIYYLGTGRSFRNHLTSRIIKYGCNAFSLYGAILNYNISTSIGLSRTIDGESKNKIDSRNVISNAEIAKLLPIQLITQNSFVLLHGGSKYKRRFIDWGAFHVEPIFLSLWKEANRILKQRNSALKSNLPAKFIETWNNQLSTTGQKIHQIRKKYIEQLLPIINELLPIILDNYNIVINYYAGWNTEVDLQDILTQNLQRDYKLGFTNYGTHRADVVFNIDNVPVQDVLSRGQQKLFILTLYLAQGILLKKLTNKQCIYLIDDLPAELDKQKCSIMIEIIKKIGAQMFITGLVKEDCIGLIDIEKTKLFHVEQGALTITT